jgi:hypothetical protein
MGESWGFDNMAKQLRIRVQRPVVGIIDQSDKVNGKIIRFFQDRIKPIRITPVCSGVIYPQHGEETIFQAGLGRPYGSADTGHR